MSLLNIIVILVMIYMPVAYTNHISLEEVEALEKQCTAANKLLKICIPQGFQEL